MLPWASSRASRSRAADEPRGTESEIVLEVAHEALFSAWPVLDRWLNEEQIFLADLERLRGAREIWREAPAEQRPKALLSGILLERARDWLARFPRRFVGRDMDELRSFVTESATAAEAQRVQRERSRRRFQVVTTAALVVVTVAAGLAVTLWRDARAQRDRVLLAQSSLLTDLARQQLEKGDAAAAMLTALEGLPDAKRGVSRPESAEAVRALYGGYYGLRELDIFSRHSGAVLDVALDRDGRRLLTASADSTAVLWDSRTGQPLLTIAGHDFKASQALFSPDGTIFLTRGLCSKRLRG
ncbi:MAG: hypothetical protein IT537_28440 [Hyphomicrobiales bacterium]|nr:hypothetical protein [Hyphomicrobiales bacterium]